MNMGGSHASLLRFLVAAACIVVIIAGLKAAASILTPFLLALLLAQSIRPFPDWLMRKRLSAGLSVLVTLLVVLVGGIAVASWLGVSIAQLIDRLPTYQVGLANLQEKAFAILAARGVNPSKLQSLEMFSPGRMVDLVGRLLGTVGQILSNALLIIFLVAVMLFQFAGGQGKSVKGRHGMERILERFQDANKDVRRYIAITAGVGMIETIAVVILLALLRVDFPFTWGVLFFFLNFIPAFGFLIALVPPAMLALLKSGWKISLVVVVAQRSTETKRTTN